MEIRCSLDVSVHGFRIRNAGRRWTVRLSHFLQVQMVGLVLVDHVARLLQLRASNIGIQIGHGVFRRIGLLCLLVCQLILVAYTSMLGYPTLCCPYRGFRAEALIAIFLWFGCCDLDHSSEKFALIHIIDSFFGVPHNFELNISETPMRVSG